MLASLNVSESKFHKPPAEALSRWKGAEVVDQGSALRAIRRKSVSFAEDWIFPGKRVAP